MVHIDSQLLSMLAGVVIPLLVGLLTKIQAASKIKAVLNSLLTILGGAVATAVTAGGDVNWQVYLFNIGIAWALSIGSYYGFYKPTGVAAALSAKTAGFGIGGP